MLKLAETSPIPELQSTLDEFVLQGARRMLFAALEAEVQSYLDQFSERDEDGRRLVVRNGRAPKRKISTGAGEIEISAPRVNDKRVIDGERQKFTSSILPPYLRRSPKVAEVLPLLYLRGLSTNDFQPALESLLGEKAAGLSATSIARLTQQWEQEHNAWRKRSLADKKYVYVYADGIHLNIRLEEDRLCVLVLIGVNEDGKKELIAVEDGHRESKESWSSILRDMRERGMEAPVLAIGDGALGFWAALRDVWPKTREQRCWFHKYANVLDKLPKRLRPKAKRMLDQIYNADTKRHARDGIKDFRREFFPKHEKAVLCLEKDQEELLTFFDFPAEHWKHLRTTNVIESAFATVRLRQKVTKGAGTRTKGLCMVFKLLDMSQLRWRRFDGYAKLKLVRAGVPFRDGIQLTNNEVTAA